MEVPYFDIRSDFLLWMILSKVFSMYINADQQFSPPYWLQRREGLVANMPRLHAVFSSGFPRALKKNNNGWEKARCGRWKSQWRIQGEGPGASDPPFRSDAYNFETEILTSTGSYI